MAEAVRRQRGLSVLNALLNALPDRNNNSDRSVRRKTCRITNDLGAKAFRASKNELASTYGAQLGRGLSLRVFKMWRSSGRLYEMDEE
jgi:hypothetical protein